MRTGLQDCRFDRSSLPARTTAQFDLRHAPACAERRLTRVNCRLRGAPTMVE
jgi:hypothetical protein